MLATASLAGAAAAVAVAALLAMRSLNSSNGAAANGATSARSTVNVRSGMEQALRYTAMAFKRGKEAADRLPCLCAARKAAPTRTDESGQCITLIDWHPVVLPSAFGAIDQQR